MDETIVTETPPLRAGWAKVGEQAKVGITGNRDKRVIYGALNPKTGKTVLMGARGWDQVSFQLFLRAIRWCFRGWHLVMFLDRGSIHKAKKSVELARELKIELRWLPVACPELNPMEGLWRDVKGKVLANNVWESMDERTERACEYILSLSPKERLRKAGVLSKNFWLGT